MGHPALEEVLEAGHAFESLAGDVQHRRQLSSSKLQIMWKGKRIKGRRWEGVVPWVRGANLKRCRKWGESVRFKFTPFISICHSSMSGPHCRGGDAQWLQQLELVTRSWKNVCFRLCFLLSSPMEDLLAAKYAYKVT